MHKKYQTKIFWYNFSVTGVPRTYIVTYWIFSPEAIIFGRDHLLPHLAKNRILDAISFYTFFERRQAVLHEKVTEIPVAKFYSGTIGLRIRVI